MLPILRSPQNIHLYFEIEALRVLKAKQCSSRFPQQTQAQPFQLTCLRSCRLDSQGAKKENESEDRTFELVQYSENPASVCGTSQGLKIGLLGGHGRN